MELYFSSDREHLKSLEGARVLVIGAGSFIGTHLIHGLLELGVELCGTYHNKKPTLPAGVELRQLDLTDRKRVRALFEQYRPQYVYNTAGYVSGSRDIEVVIPAFETNLLGSINVLLAAAAYPVKRLILFGSMDEIPQKGRDPLLPVSPYAASKLASTAYARMFLKLYQVPVVISQVFIAYGPNQGNLAMLIPYTILSVLRGQPTKFTEGNRKADWIYISDVVTGLIHMLIAPGIEGRYMELGTGVLTSVREIVNRIFQELQTEARPGFGALPSRPMETEVVADLDRIKQQLHWQPKVSLEEGISRTVDWYRDAFEKGMFKERN